MNAPAKTNTTINTDPLTIDASLIRAATACQAKNDVRYYLEGIYISNTGIIAGTNGHMMFVANLSDIKPEKSNIIRLESKIPLSSDTCEFYFIDSKHGYVKHFNSAKHNDKHIHFSIIDGKYPDIDKLRKDFDKDSTALDCAYINPEHLSFIPKVFGKKNNGIKISFTKKDGVIKFTPAISHHRDNNANPTLYIMPMRYPDNAQH
ncbi:MAG: hypothetical protein OEY11_14640 [Gammaproteobacteria bacterium]|nr:hypothetical protein [Gammaproteobacteria bacterium]